MDTKPQNFTKFEVARILGARALQIAMDAPLLLKISDSDLKTEVTFDKVKAAVFSFAEAKHQQGSRQLAISLTTSVIEFVNNSITITINNETQREQLQSIKQELIDDLRKTLNNNLIALQISITQGDIQSKAYKPADVFKNMAEKNPSLLELKKRFDLEIDY